MDFNGISKKIYIYKLVLHVIIPLEYDKGGLRSQNLTGLFFNMADLTLSDPIQPYCILYIQVI